MKRTVCGTAMGLLVGVALAAPGRAEDKRQWEIEIHAGGLLSSSPSGGQSQMPPAGAAFSTFGGHGTTRHVPSWYFGDGAALFNAVVDAFPGQLQQITPLDPVLQGAALERGTGGNLGLRLSRRVSRRLTAELGLDYGLAQTKLSSQSQAGIEASRASFLSAWDRILGSGVQSVSSVVATSGGSRRLLASAAVNVDLAMGHKLEPYVTLGGGLVSEQGKELSVNLVGDYQIRQTFRLSNGTTYSSSFHEIDTVTLRFRGGSSPFGLVGFGVKYRVTPRWGVRLDVREHLSGHKDRTQVDATPSFTPQATPSGLSLNPTNAPSLQFSNYAPVGSSTLSPPALSGFETFKGTGMQSQVSVTVGVFLRF